MLVHPDVGRLRRTVHIALLAAVVAVVALAAPLPVGAQAPTPAAEPYAPLVLAGADGTPRPVADPEVIRVGDTWYLYGTSSGQGFEVWSSTDLRTWAYQGIGWRPTSGAWNDRGEYWAPDLHVDTSGYWMYYSAGQRIGVARADSPLGPFEDVLDHPLVGDGFGGVGDGVPDVPNLSQESAIDAHLLAASDGSLTLYFTRYTPLGVIAALPMDDLATPAPSGPRVVLDAEPDSWEGLIREAPFVIERGGTYHLLYSGYGADSPCYAIGVATATDPLGPFTRSPDNPILHQDPSIAFFGPGHPSVVEGPDGGLLGFFHTKDSGDIGYRRSIRAAPLDVDERGEVRFPRAPGSSGAPGATCGPAGSDPTTPVPPAPVATSPEPPSVASPAVPVVGVARLTG